MKKPKGRADGEGSIYQDGATWLAQISIKGVLVRRRCKTQALALVKLDELREKRKKRLNLTEKDLTLTEWTEISLSANRRLKEGSNEEYRARLKRYALPTLGRYRLPELSSELLQDWINELDDRGLAPNTIQGAYSCLRSVLARAQRARKIDYNPAVGLELPSGRKRTPIALTEEQVKALIAVALKHRYAALYILAVVLGLRQGELLALKWSDVSWRQKTLSIKRTLRRNGSKVRENTAKTESSERLFDLDDDLIAVLRRHWQLLEEERQIHEKKQLDIPKDKQKPWNPDRRVFCNERGATIAAATLICQFDKMKAKADMPDGLVFHDLRHTAGSLMVTRGHDIVDVSRILGHSSPAVTMRIYLHSYKNKRRQATADLSAALLRKDA